MSELVQTVLASADPVFAALCRRAFQGTSLELLAAVPPDELLESARELEPELIVLDVDGDDVMLARRLAT